MATKMEEVEVRYCDICGIRERDTHRSFLKCSECGKDVCSQHWQLVKITGLGPDWNAYLCDDCQKQVEEDISPLLKRMKTKEV